MLLLTHHTCALGAVVICKRRPIVINITVKEATSKWEIKHFPLTWRKKPHKDNRNTIRLEGCWIIDKKTHLQLIMGYIVLLESISIFLKKNITEQRNSKIKYEHIKYENMNKI